MAEDALEAELAALATMSSARLRQQWTELTGAPAPRVSPSLLRLALAWELQARQHGGHSRKTTGLLDQFERGKTRTRAPEPGMRLVRAWNGRTHIVTIGENGVIRWNDRDWRSLSAVARAITGTRWSGPAFFGLREAGKAA